MLNGPDISYPDCKHCYVLLSVVLSCWVVPFVLVFPTPQEMPCSIYIEWTRVDLVGGLALWGFICLLLILVVQRIKHALLGRVPVITTTQHNTK